MKKVFIFFFILIGLHATAQDKVSSGLFLKRNLTNQTARIKPTDILIKGDVKQIRDIVHQLNGKIIGTAGDIVSARLLLGNVATLLQQPYIARIEANFPKYRTMNDTMRMLCRVNEVQAGQSPLPNGYNGSGVVMGIIDSGLDLNQPDFKDSTGHTRVKWLWDQTMAVATNTPSYGYGQEFSNSDIDGGLASAHTGEDQYGHGTYVAGIAAGNGLASGNWRGVAPNTDLIIVGYDFAAVDNTPRLAHAVEYIFTKAQAMGKPCVINASLGAYMGSHDGTDLESQYISNLINQQAGRSVVASAGNLGVLYPIHIGHTCTPTDTSFSWFVNDASLGGAYVQIYGDSAQFSNIQFAIGADKVSPYYSFRGATAFTTITPSINNVVTQNLMVGPRRIGVIQTYTSFQQGVCELEIFVVPDSTNYYWRFMATGSGRFDSYSALNFAYDGWQFHNVPTVAAYPDMAHYIMPDTTQSIVSGIACLDNVITVGNYYNTDRHVDYNGVLQITSSDKPRQLAENSSRGPTRDGRIKPDITAPGHHILSSGVLTLISTYITTQPYKVSLDGFHVTGGGTSASSPVVAGIAALYLQQNPTANWADIKNAIISCSQQDTNVWGPLPNNAWGYGKADAFGAMTTCGFVGIPDVESTQLIHLFPNPARHELTVSTTEALRDHEILITDMLGKVVEKINATGTNTVISLKNFREGIYFVRMNNNGDYVIKRFEKVDN